MENKQLNRLNENESRIWDRCFRYFVKTGEWPMGMTDGKHLDIEDQPARKSGRNIKEPVKITDEQLSAMDENPSPFEPPMVNGIMAKPEGRHPMSRDFALEGKILCNVEDCIANKTGVCVCPSLISINSQRKCNGYYPRK